MGKKVKSYWWCIEKGCKYKRVHYTHKGKVVEHIGCSHPDLLDQYGPVNPNLGVPIGELQMCPMLVSDIMTCFKSVFDE
mgnify:CR=1 FL=1